MKVYLVLYFYFIFEEFKSYRNSDLFKVVQLIEGILGEGFMSLCFMSFFGWSKINVYILELR